MFHHGETYKLSTKLHKKFRRDVNLHEISFLTNRMKTGNTTLQLSPGSWGSSGSPCNKSTQLATIQTFW